MRGIRRSSKHFKMARRLLFELYRRFDVTRSVPRTMNRTNPAALERELLDVDFKARYSHGGIGHERCQFLGLHGRTGLWWGTVSGGANRPAHSRRAGGEKVDRQGQPLTPRSSPATSTRVASAAACSNRLPTARRA